MAEVGASGVGDSVALEATRGLVGDRSFNEPGLDQRLDLALECARLVRNAQRVHDLCPACCRRLDLTENSQLIRRQSGSQCAWRSVLVLRLSASSCAPTLEGLWLGTWIVTRTRSTTSSIVGSGKPA